MTVTTAPRTVLDAPRVLLLEDDVELASVAADFLTGGGARVSVTHDGTTAWALISSRRFDVLVLDAIVPGVHGLELCRMIRRGDIWTSVIMVVLAVIALVQGLFRFLAPAGWRNIGLAQCA